MGELDFGGFDYQGKPKGGYWLPKELWTWPDIRALSLSALGTFVDFGIWAAEGGQKAIQRYMVSGKYAPGVPELLESGLWRKGRKHEYITRTIPELRAGRGRPGLIIRVSRLLASGTYSPKTAAAFGLWALGASWSLNTDVPGYVPTEAALQLGKRKHVAELWHCGLWLASEHGFLMSKGSHPIEPLWDLTRDDERAPIPPALRQAVYDRDGWKCVICGFTADLTLDHIVPWSLGGPDTFGNLRTLCRPCNSSKGARVE